MHITRYIAIVFILAATISQCTKQPPGYQVHNCIGLTYTITHWIDDDFTGLIGYKLEPDYTGEIEFIEVCSGYEGQGIGRSLLQNAITDLENKGAHTVNVMSEPEAKGFYEHYGFCQCSTNSDDLTMYQYKLI